MATINKNLPIVDFYDWEQLAFAPATGIAGTNICDDGYRFIYIYFQTSTTAAQFWRYDTWGDTYQQLATPPTQTGTVANMNFVHNVGGQFGGETSGSIYMFVGNGTICYLYKYTIATNTWLALSTTGVPATFATDCYLASPSPSRNNWVGGYHTGVLRTVTLSAAIAVGATTASVTALPEAMPIGTRLRFGTFSVTLSSASAYAATSLAVVALPQGLASGTVLKTNQGNDVVLSAAAAAGATSISVYPMMRALASGEVITVYQFIVLTAAAAAAATSITIASALYSVDNASTSLYYGNMYLIGNSGATWYRYNLGANTWSTTSANAGNPALPVITAATGTGCALKWLPAMIPDKLFCLRGAATSSAYIYDLVANTWSTEVYSNTTETFTTGTSVASRAIGNRQSRMLISKESTGRIYEACPSKNTLEPKMNQTIYPNSTAVVGDKALCMNTIDGLEFYYALLNSSTAFVRCMMLDT